MLFGMPPEDYWIYGQLRYRALGLLLCLAQNHQALQYIRLDPSGSSREAVLKAVKTSLAARFPSIRPSPNAHTRGRGPVQVEGCSRVIVMSVVGMICDCEMQAVTSCKTKNTSFPSSLSMWSLI